MIRENFDNKRILFGITTNALLLENNEIIKFLADNFEYSLSISIDGTKKFMILIELIQTKKEPMIA